MSRIQQLAKMYGQHIATAWQRTIAGSQRVIMIVYDKELERDILAHKTEFEIVTKEGNHDWFEINIASAFAEWMAEVDYREAYFNSPDDLQLKIEAEFTPFVAAKLCSVLDRPDVTESSVVALFGGHATGVQCARAQNGGPILEGHRARPCARPRRYRVHRGREGHILAKHRGRLPELEIEELEERIVPNAIWSD